MINLGTIKIPLNSATKTFGILAKRGAGKTYAGAVMAEEFFSNNIPFVVFDPIDMWWGLKIDKNGKEKGLPIVVFGIEHSDIKLERDMGRKIAQAIVKHNVSCIISTFGMPKVGQRHLMTEFAEELLTINDTPRHVFIEEAHEFVPQRVFGQLGKTFNAVSNLVVMGRNRGIGVTLINQRAATINKDVLTQVDAIIALRSVGPQDKKALGEYASFHGVEDDKRFIQFINSLPSLPTGEAWLWSPEFLNVFEKIKIRQRRTFHPDREKIGSNFDMPVLNQVDIQDFIDSFKKSSTKPVQLDQKEKKEQPIRESIDFVALRNTYESKLMQKDIELRQLKSTIASIRKMVGSDVQVSDIQTTEIEVNNNVGMWVSKLGNTGASRILKFLSAKSGMKFTRSQVALGVGMAAKGGSFATYISTLKRNSLILEEGGFIKISPDL
jgi:hypothetical protein